MNRTIKSADPPEAPLQAFLQHELPDARNIRISSLQPAQAGSSTENWIFDASWRQAGQDVQAELILRKAPQSEVVLVERANEFALLRALEKTEFPAPKAYCFDADGRWLGRPGMVLQRCRGVARRNLLAEGSGLDLQARLGLATQIADLLSSLHSLDLAKLDLASGVRIRRTETARSLLDSYEQELAQEASAVEMKLAGWWLRDHLPDPPVRSTVVHGDFRPANLLVDAGRVTAVLDWEFAHIGDPAEDIGWYLAKIYRSEHFIPGRWSPDDFVSRYERRTGTSVNVDSVRYWMVFALYKLAWIALSTVRAFRRGDANRLISGADRHVGALLRAISESDTGGLP
jgi:aminoglycoside phosphotransferase (APT) family kinase protein